MREFFIGWRRKAGCGLLMMACGLMLVWFRSFIYSDIVSVDAGPGFVTIGGGQCALMRGPFGPSNCAVASWEVIDFNANTFVALPNWQRRGIYSEPLGQSVDPETVTTLQLSWITLAIAALSAYLILWKPRPKE